MSRAASIHWVLPGHTAPRPTSLPESKDLVHVPSRAPKTSIRTFQTAGHAGSCTDYGDKEGGASDVGALSIEREEDSQSRTGLKRSFQNPFNPSTTIPFALERRQAVCIMICDAHGRRVRVLLERVLDARAHRVVWDGRNEGGSEVARGLHFCLMTTPCESYSSKTALIRWAAGLVRGS